MKRCQDCRHFSQLLTIRISLPLWWYDGLWPINWHTGQYVCTLHFRPIGEHNKNGDCTSYERKWYKFWR